MTSKKGFTLIEMVVTLAIVLILTSSTSIVVSDMLQRSRAEEAQVQEHIDKYEVAKAQVDGYLAPGYVPPSTSAGGTSASTVLPTSPPTTTAATTTAATTTAATTTAATTTTATTTAATTTTAPTTTVKTAGRITVGSYTTPVISGTPSAYANTKTVTSKGWDEYDYNALFTIPAQSYDQYVAIYLPPGTIDIIVWYSCTLEAFDPVSNIAVISVAAYNNKPAIRVNYNGAGQSNWNDTRIFDIAKK